MVFFLVKKMEFVDFQPFVCPWGVHCDSEHKKIHLYFDKKYYGKSLYAILNRKELGEIWIVFQIKTKKNVIIVTIMIIAYIAKN